MLWRRLLLAGVVLGGVSITAWIWTDLPESNSIVFDLTAMEVKTETGPLRHHDATLLRCQIVDDDGSTVASIEHKIHGPVTHEVTVDAQPGDYRLDISIHFQRANEAPRIHTLTRQETLKGESKRIQL